jgi:hypothetical protein
MPPPTPPDPESAATAECAKAFAAWFPLWVRHKATGVPLLPAAARAAYPIARWAQQSQGAAGCFLGLWPVLDGADADQRAGAEHLLREHAARPILKYMLHRLTTRQSPERIAALFESISGRRLGDDAEAWTAWIDEAFPKK